MGAGVTVAGVAGAGAGNATSLELELVYVGPLNLWGGLALFCDAVNGLLLDFDATAAKEGTHVTLPFHAVTFIGEDGPLSGFGGSGRTGSEAEAYTRPLFSST